MKVYLLFCFMFISSLAVSQVEISGKLTNETGKPIVGATVTINQRNTNIVLSYAISNNQGEYRVLCDIKDEMVDLHVSSMAYATESRLIRTVTQRVNFILEEKNFDLNEITVLGNPITKRGDTINYNIASFAKEQDRSIADVLNRLPGIEVFSNGQIHYQGRPINKYYIEGLDLLEGKYKLANENLPHKDVSTIQILENHQPVKVLDSLVFSDNAALNIKLKNEYTSTGQVILSTGLYPILWEANITPLLLTSKKQMLLTYQSNNSGNNLSSQLKKLTLDEMLDRLENEDSNHNWLHIQQLNPPSFSRKRWLDNRTHLLSANYLQKLKKEYEVKLGVSLLSDRQQQRGYTNTKYFTSFETVDLLENKHNTLYNRDIYAKLTLHKNTNRNHLVNNLQFQRFNSNQQGNILNETNILTQHLNNEQTKLNNKLKTTFIAGKQLINLSSFIGYKLSPQTLIINPGQYKHLINKGKDYEEVKQSVDLSSFYTNNSIGLTYGWKDFSFSPKFGFTFENQVFKSKIETSENHSLEKEFYNNLNWAKTRLYFDIINQYQKGKWRIEAKLPVNLYLLSIIDQELQQGEELHKFRFEPSFYAKYDINSFWDISAATSLNNQLGTINQLSYAFILVNYRSIERTNTALPQIFNQNYVGRISYRNPIYSIFGDITYISTKSKYNLLYRTYLAESGAKEIDAIEQFNNRNTNDISARISKNIYQIKTNIALSAGLKSLDYKQIINDDLHNIVKLLWSFGGKIENYLTDQISTEYRGNMSFSKNKTQDISNKTISQQSHKVNLNFYATKKQYVSLQTEFSVNNIFTEKSENIFADLLYRFAWIEKNIDFELLYNNILNNKNYQYVNIDSFSYIETSYQLRPSQVLLKVRFSL